MMAAMAARSRGRLKNPSGNPGGETVVSESGNAVTRGLGNTTDSALSPLRKIATNSPLT